MVMTAIQECARFQVNVETAVQLHAAGAWAMDRGGPAPMFHADIT